MDSVREMHGLANVLLRLRFAFGESVRVHIRSRTGEWSNVCVEFEGEDEKHVQNPAGG